jgi:pyruvate formate lyase activating enzyme
MSIDMVMHEIEKDREFYDESGGLTASGGEPLAQPAFLHDLLTKCKAAGIHTTVDTSGYAEQKALAKLSRNVDLFLYDLKVMDAKKHRVHTGVSNEPIINNLNMLDKRGKQIIIRFPLIPHVNASRTELTSMCEIVKGLKNVQRISLLPYHQLGVDKAKRLGKEPEIYATPSARLLNRSLELIRSYGLTADSP